MLWFNKESYSCYITNANNHVDKAFHDRFEAKGANEAKEVNCKQHNINCPSAADKNNHKEILTDSSANHRNSSQPHVTLTPQDKRIPEQRDVNRRVRIIFIKYVFSTCICTIVLSILFFFPLIHLLFQVLLRIKQAIANH